VAGSPKELKLGEKKKKRREGKGRDRPLTTRCAHQGFGIWEGKKEEENRATIMVAEKAQPHKMSEGEGSEKKSNVGKGKQQR